MFEFELSEREMRERERERDRERERQRERVMDIFVVSLPSELKNMLSSWQEKNSYVKTSFIKTTDMLSREICLKFTLGSKSTLTYCFIL